jgi:flagellar hook-length control protein FliK
VAKTVPVDIENAPECKTGRPAIVPEGDDKDKSGDASAAVTPAQLSAAAESALPPAAGQNPQDQTVELVGGDAFAQLVNAVPTTKPATTSENSARKQAAGEHDNHDNTVDPRRLKAAAAPERKAAETGATRVADAAEVSPGREPGASARVSDDGSASAPFTQAFAAERSKVPAAETDAREAAPSPNAAAANRAMSSADEASAPHLQSARLTANESQAEMQVGLHTADYGHVEIKASLQNSTVGATIAVEHAALRDQIVSALPELKHSFTERQITLESLTVSDSLSATTAFANSHQQRSNQQQAAVPDQGSQQRRAEPDWEAKPGASSGLELQPWSEEAGSALNVLV